MRPGNSPTWSCRGVGPAFLFGLAALALTGCGSATDDRPPQWSYIYPSIIQPSCATASCHSDIAQRSGVDLYNQDIAWVQLTDRHFVEMGDPARSEVIHLMRANGARRMPPDFALPEVDIRLIEAWIAAGAKED